MTDFDEQLKPFKSDVEERLKTMADSVKAAMDNNERNITGVQRLVQILGVVITTAALVVAMIGGLTYWTSTNTFSKVESVDGKVTELDNRMDKLEGLVSENFQKQSDLILDLDGSLQAVTASLGDRPAQIVSALENINDLRVQLSTSLTQFENNIVRLERAAQVLDSLSVISAEQKESMGQLYLINQKIDELLKAAQAKPPQ
jgi:hypothetical protein